MEYYVYYGYGGGVQLNVDNYHCSWVLKYHCVQLTDRNVMIVLRYKMTSLPFVTVELFQSAYHPPILYEIYIDLILLLNPEVELVSEFWETIFTQYAYNLSICCRCRHKTTRSEDRHVREL